jgi:mono/diheme cytochrome c family protein
LRSAQVQNCRIFNNSQHGVLCHDNGKGFFEFNEIYGNQLAGVEIRDGGNPTFRQNVIHGHTGRAKSMRSSTLCILCDF